MFSESVNQTEWRKYDHICENVLTFYQICSLLKQWFLRMVDGKKINNPLHQP